MPEEAEYEFGSDDEKDVEIAYWTKRALDAERLLELERQYIEDLYELRDTEAAMRDKEWRRSRR